MPEIGLNLGCGGLTRFPNTEKINWINIDIRTDVDADIICDCKKLPYPNNYAVRIAVIHLFEHIPRLEMPIALKEWYRVLKTGGFLEIEVPNFDLTIKEYLEGDDKKQEIRIENVYGRQHFNGDAHHWGFNFKRLSKLLREHGFKNIKESFDYSYHIEYEPCLKVIAQKLL